MLKELWLVWNSKDGPQKGHLTRYDPAADYEGEDGKAWAKPTRNDVTAEQVAEYLDNELENENSHSFVGATKWLCESIKNHASEQVAKNVMLELLDAGGLSECSQP